ncbi:MAG: hypothetical protein SF187_30610 [Deltaproteobacteria bacterium]|nr:hypothetical protein [Deltaproteobacteria bacterium]
MLLVALRSPPFDAPLVANIATALHLTPADVRPRTTGPGPWVLSIANEGLDEGVARLASLGIHAVLVDPALTPTDDDRVLARSLTITKTQLLVTDGGGVTHACPWPSLALLQRGTRNSTTRQTTKTTQRKLSMGRALLTGGLSLTKKEVVEETKTTLLSERFVLLSRNDGESDVMLYERRVNYQFLGPAMQASSFANLQSAVALILTHQPVPEDARVATPGFVGRLPKTRVDPVDLALHLAQLVNVVN